MSCHDVSNNADGKDSRLADQTGVTNNLSLDPAYCDLALHLHLAMTSPCAAATLSPWGLRPGGRARRGLRGTGAHSGEPGVGSRARTADRPPSGAVSVRRLNFSFVPPVHEAEKAKESFAVENGFPVLSCQTVRSAPLRTADVCVSIESAEIW